MHVLNCTILIDNPLKDKLIGILKDVLTTNYVAYSPKIFLVLQEIQEGVSNVSVQFFIGENKTHQSFEENEFQVFIEAVSAALGSSIQCFLTPLLQY